MEYLFDSISEYQKLDWICFAIQEALNGNNGELEQALALAEEMRDKEGGNDG